MYKRYYLVFAWALIFLPVVVIAQPDGNPIWIRIIPASDTGDKPIAKRTVQQLSNVKGDRNLHLLIQGSSTLANRAAVLWLAKKWNKIVYRVDLSQVLSKYIGETEKNLSSVFADTRAKTGILYFDEADALFGRRTPVRDSHDRYANQETSYLMKRIESYEGIVALASNLNPKTDSVFIRHFKYIIKTE